MSKTNEKTTRYSSMLLFTPDQKQVVLLTKDRPAFLAGKLCPVGGRPEGDETPLETAVREFEEEAGVYLEPEAWLEYALCSGPGWTMHCFVAFSDKALQCTTKTEEEVSIHSVGSLLSEIQERPGMASADLTALIGLALAAPLRKGYATIAYQ